MDKTDFNIKLDELDWNYTYQDENGLIYYMVDKTIFCGGVVCHNMPDINYRIYGKKSY